MNNYVIAEKMEMEAACEIYLLNTAENIQNINRSIVPPDQIDYIGQYKMELDRYNRLLARSFLYELINKQCGIDNFELKLNKYRKPFLKATEKIIFSFSYANNYVLVGISEGRKIGVDIEYLNPSLSMGEIASTIMSEAELDQFLLFPDHSFAQRHYFFKLFSTKEAIVKAFGSGLFFNPQKINTSGNNQFTYEQDTFICCAGRLWKGKYSIGACLEQ